ncbi:PepSY-associated TM helix domain-containing protein [Salisaeta longa]|uniref:PepSY-associated TM helix domain-containing protein n=1 Tax=Salisaeta longa TaxID=503170 RepID=UPI0003B5F180|nr:PepSY-associated TM helix domain-containing protein [Salisaeta longa]
MGNWRKTLFRLHGWIGLNLGLLLFVICFSGTVATLSYEIDALIHPSHRVENVPADASVDWTAMHKTLAAAFPNGTNLGVYVTGSPYVAALPDAAAVAYVEQANDAVRKVYLNPYTGALQGDTSFFNAQRFFRSFHRRFFDGNRGIVIVTLMGVPLLLSILSGFLFYKGWLKQMITLRWDRGPRLRWSDLHKGAGIWGLLFSLIIALTGIFYFVEIGFQGAGNYAALLPKPLPQVNEATLDRFGPRPELLPAGTYVARATAAFPELTAHAVRMPTAPDDAVYVAGQAGNPLTRDRANKVLLHPFTGEVLGVQRSSSLGVVPFITDAADPLHFGYFGGLATKILWCVFGLILSFAVLSGTYLWVVRSMPRQRRPQRSGDEAAEPSDAGLGPVPLLRGAVVATALVLAYFGVVSVSTVQGIRYYAPTPAPKTVASDLAAGPFRLDVQCRMPCDAGREATFIAQFRGAGLPNLQRAALVLPGDSVVALEGPARAPRATVTAAPNDTLQLALTQHDGTTHRAAFAVPRTPSVQAASLPAWPRVPNGVWGVVGAFLVLTAGFIAGWLMLLVRAFRAKRQTLQRKARRKRSGPAKGVTLPPGATLPPSS